MALKGGGAASDATKMVSTQLESGNKATRFYIKNQNSSSLANYIFGSRKNGYLLLNASKKHKPNTIKKSKSKL